MNSIMWEEISQDKSRYVKICQPNNLLLPKEECDKSLLSFKKK
jgi:hypothetical protein